jgi:hypothetical protein
MPISGTDGSLDPIDLPIIARKDTSFRRDNAQSARFAYPKTGPIQLMRPCHCVTWHGLASIYRWIAPTEAQEWERARTG